MRAGSTWCMSRRRSSRTLPVCAGPAGTGCLWSRPGTLTTCLSCRAACSGLQLRTHGIERPITVLPTGIDRREFPDGDRAAFRRRHGIPADRPMLVYVGRVAHEKNIDFLLDMLVELRPRLPGVLLALAGEGPAVPHLRRRCASWVLRTRCSSWVICAATA